MNRPQIGGLMFDGVELRADYSRHRELIFTVIVNGESQVITVRGEAAQSFMLALTEFSKVLAHVGS